MKKKWLLKIFYTAIFLPLTLFWGELFVHILLPQNVDNILNIIQADPIVGYTYQPKAKASETGREYNVSYRTNSLGLRDREYNLEEKGVFRVLLFGDSFSESHGLSLDKSLPKQIEQYLQKEINRKNLELKAQVVNISFGGYSPYHYWKSYSRWKSVFHPDLILVGFYMGNDFQCEDENIRYRVDNGEIVGWYYPGNASVIQKKSFITSIRKWLAHNSELYVLLRNFFYYNDTVGFLTNRAKAKESTKQIAPYLIPEPQTAQINRKKCFEYLKRLKDEAALDSVPVALVAIPAKLEIENSYLEQIIKTQGLNPNAVNLDKPYKEIADFCHSTGIYFFAPRVDMKKESSSSNSLYFMYDGHWNSKGINVASKSIINQWEKQNLVPFDYIPAKPKR